MLLGAVCTRDCGFCAVQGGVPAPASPDEPVRVAQAARELRLDYVVVTSVTRDDLPDGGAAYFAATIRALRTACGEGNTKVEVLTPDFGGAAAAIDAVVAARPDVYNHNVETVPRLYPHVRPLADYRRSLDLLARVEAVDPSIVTKSGLMVGLGEEAEEVAAVMRDLRSVGCRALTIGQYLQPSRAHLPVTRFVPPEEFAAWREEGLALGFQAVASAPFVRSSYLAREVFERREAVRDRRPGADG
jgi:lipoic acid synthetase